MNEVDPIGGRLDSTDGVRGLTPSYALANFFVRFAAMRPFTPAKVGGQDRFRKPGFRLLPRTPIRGWPE
jgi:hypothetical protein